MTEWEKLGKSFVLATFQETGQAQIINGQTKPMFDRRAKNMNDRKYVQVGTYSSK